MLRSNVTPQRAAVRERLLTEGAVLVGDEIVRLFFVLLQTGFVVERLGAVRTLLLVGVDLHVTPEIAGDRKSLFARRTLMGFEASVKQNMRFEVGSRRVPEASRKRDVKRTPYPRNDQR